MSEVLVIIQGLLDGNVPSIKLVLLLFISLCLYKILGKYVEHCWFNIFPLSDLKKQNSALQRELSSEILRHNETKRIAVFSLTRQDQDEATKILTEILKNSALSQKTEQEYHSAFSNND